MMMGKGAATTVAAAACLLCTHPLSSSAFASGSPLPTRHHSDRSVSSGLAVGAAQTTATPTDDDDDQPNTHPRQVIDLQAQHPAQTPSQMLRDLAQFCDDNDIDAFDVYGDFGASPDASYLRQFEAEVAHELGMDDGVFMPSGVMAQSIALLIHRRHRGGPRATGLNNVADEEQSPRGTFACHRTSHLLLHEGEAYSELLNLDAIVLPLGSDGPCGGSMGNTLGVGPMRLVDVEELLCSCDGSSIPSTIILELPHREVGGKLTPWEEVEQMGTLCKENGIAFHADGARLFEAAAGYGLSLRDISKPFDSVYVSFYKGIGGIAGAMLLGNEEFCSESRMWLRRFGGNLYTLLPYVISARAGFQARASGEGDGPTFAEKRDKIRRIVKRLSSDDAVRAEVTFDPAIPETNMVHGFVRSPLDDCQEAVDAVCKQSGVKVLSRVRAITKDEEESTAFECRFEWTMGDANAAVPDESFVASWKELARVLAEKAEE